MNTSLINITEKKNSIVVANEIRFNKCSIIASAKNEWNAAWIIVIIRKTSWFKSNNDFTAKPLEKYFVNKLIDHNNFPGDNNYTDSQTK